MPKSLDTLLKDFVQFNLVASNSNESSKHAKYKRPSQALVVDVFFTIRFGENLYVKII